MSKQSYRLVTTGKDTVRRDYTKYSGTLPIPNLVEIQTNSFDWFMKEGIREVFEEVYPIQNYSGNIRLKFIGYEFGEPKYSLDECKYREVNYTTPLKARMELEMVDSTTGEVIIKEDEVFLGRDFSTKKNISEAVTSEIDHEIRSIIEEAYAKTSELLSENMDKLHMIAEGLVELETLDAEQFERLFNGESVEVLKAEYDAKRSQQQKEREEARIKAEKELEISRKILMGQVDPKTGRYVYPYQ